MYFLFLCINASQGLYRTCVTYEELTLLPPGKAGLQICEDVHFLANCAVIQPTPGQADPVLVPFTFSHFHTLLLSVDVEAKRDANGSCAAIQFLLNDLYESRIHSSFPGVPAAAGAGALPGVPAAGAAQGVPGAGVAAAAVPQGAPAAEAPLPPPRVPGGAGVPAAAPNPQAPVTGFELLQPLLHTLGSKSAASITGAPAAAIIYSFVALASGLNALDTVVPKVLLTLKSAPDVAHVRSRKCLALVAAGNSVAAKELALRTNPHTDRRIAFAARTNSNDAKLLSAVFLGVGIDLADAAGANDYNPVAPPADGAIAYVQRVLHHHLLSLVNHIESVYETTPESIDFSGYSAHEKPVTVLDIVGRVYPALQSLLTVQQQQHIVSIALRPLMAHLAVKVCIIYLRDYVYTFTQKKNSLNIPIVDARHYLPPFTTVPGSFDCFSLTSLIAEYLITPVGLPQIADINALNTRNEEIVEMLEIIRDTSLFESTTPRQEQLCGAATSRNARRVRRLEYVSDLVNGNNASKKSNNSNPFRRGGQPGVVKVCEKASPTTPNFSPGIMVQTCLCSKRKVYHASFMDQHESVLTPFEALLNRFPDGCPPYVVYDNACHLLMYCVQREPSWFWACRFVVDRFHEPNHVQSCSSSIHTSSYTSGPLYTANTQAVEQVNKVLRARLETRLRFMNLDHAVVFLRLFLAWFNAYSS